MRKIPVNRLALSPSLLARVVAGDGTSPATGAGPWLDPTGGQTASSTPLASGAGPALDPHGSGPA